jgi:hypothetical protein
MLTCLLSCYTESKTGSQAGRPGVLWWCSGHSCQSSRFGRSHQSMDPWVESKITRLSISISGFYYIIYILLESAHQAL